jgi:glycerophosphoryl diester phosphodiesterase
MRHLPYPAILAHQGGEKEWPSNTMYAFERAYRAGSDVLDIDLQMSKDRVLVLIHDTTVDRTTNGSGKVCELTWSELEKLDAAYSFSPDGTSFPLRGQGVRIGRLDEVLTAFPDWRLQIEVKEAPLEIAAELARLLGAHQAQDRVLLSSFRPDLMAELRKHCPDVASSATPSEIRTMVLASWLHLESLVSPDYCAFQVPISRYGLPLVTGRTVAAAHSRGVTVLPWTIDSETDLAICQQAGADGINTNLPSKMLALRSGWPPR